MTETSLLKLSLCTSLPTYYVTHYFSYGQINCNQRETFSALDLKVCPPKEFSCYFMLCKQLSWEINHQTVFVCVIENITHHVGNTIRNRVNVFTVRTSHGAFYNVQL